MNQQLAYKAAKTIRRKGPVALSKRVYSHAVSPIPLLKTKSVWYRMQGHTGVGDTATLLQVPVENLTHRLNTDWLDRPFPKEFSIRGGDWDERVKPFETDPKYQYIKQFHETGEFQDRTEVLPDWDKSEGHREQFERLYTSIKQSGYKTQRELHDGARIFDEINVCIGRDGTMSVKHGHHRVSIAKVLGLETVPVYVRARHKDWQVLRDEVWDADRTETVSSRASQYLDHPDMQAIINA